VSRAIGEETGCERRSKLGLSAVVFFGLCLVAFGVMLVRGMQTPELYSSHALIKGLVEAKPLMKHLKGPEVLAGVRDSCGLFESGVSSNESALVAVPVLARRLNIKRVSGGESIELRASATSPKRARALLDTWIEFSRESWPESVEQTHPLYGPFLIVARSSPDPDRP